MVLCSTLARSTLSNVRPQNLKGVILEGCAHWIYEENARETLSLISNFLGSANAVP
jgi:hypothetical protein